MNWKEVYQLPLKNDPWGCYAWAKNETMSLMFDFGVTKEDQQKIVDIINGTIEYDMPDIRHDEVDFFDGDTYIFCVRGWGNLTGIGALNLSSEEAAKIQDDFCNYILEQLSE